MLIIPVEHNTVEMDKKEETQFFVRMTTFATAACFADFVTFPFDVAKVRLQVQGETIKGSTNSTVVYRGLYGTISTIVHKEGYRSLFNGLSAGLQRQLCFSSIRLGCYDKVKEAYTDIYNDSVTALRSKWHVMNSLPGEIATSTVHIPKKESNLADLNLPVRIAAGLTTGFMCVLIAQPTDVVKIKFQAMSKNSLVRYRTTGEAYKTIYKNEGFSGLWRGSIPNATRNAITNVAEIVVYDTVKDFLLMKNLMSDNIFCHFTTASIAGLCTTIVASPVDVIKTRYMNSHKGQYTGAIHCAVKTFKKEGFSAFYKGFVPSFCRIASWNVVLWISFEQLKALEKNLHVA